MSLVTQIAALAARVAAEIKLLRTEFPPDLPTYTAGSPTPPPLTYDVVGDVYLFDAAKTPCLVTDPATGAVRWELGLNVEYVGTTYDILVAGMTVGLGGGANQANMALGTGTLFSNTTGFGITAVGAYALSANTSGNYNAGVGYSALSSLITGSDNTVLGALAGSQLETGGSNTFVGRSAGSLVKTGSSNTIIGRYNGSTSLTGTIVLAAGVTVRAWCDNTGKWGFGTGTSTLTASIETQGDSIRIRTASTPASATDVGEPGTFRWDATAVHFCVDVNTWKSLPYSDFGATSPGGGGGTVGIPTYVQETEPAAPAIWYKTDASGSVIDILRVT